MKLFFTFLLVLLILGQYGIAQTNLCEGSLGENIFTDGDFGSGLPNVVINDPQLAPGYNYQPSPPPQDGWYTLTNNTTNWGSFANTFWVNVGDNSSDPEGYMMVVNASDLPGVFYERTIDDLCENSTYQFSADIINLFKPGENGNLPNIDFLLDGQVQYSTGNILEDAMWNTYGFQFTTGSGETSKTLTLRNNAPGGFGNDLALDNISFRACGPDVFISTTAPVICDGESAEMIATVQDNIYADPVYQWQESTDNGFTWMDLPNGQNLNYPLPNPVDGVFYRLLVANGSNNLQNTKCRIISNVHILEIQPIFFDVQTTLCEGLSLMVGNSVYTETGIYVDSLIASYGCDSIVTTDLTIVANDLNASFVLENPDCFGESSGSLIIDNVAGGSGIYSYTINDGPFQDKPDFLDLSSGQYIFQIVDTYGCDYSDTVVVSDPSELIVDLGESVRISLGEDFQINSFLNQTVDNFTWSPTENLSCTDCLDPLASPTETITYTLSAFLSDSCFTADSLTIIVDKNRRLYFPNAFSPNGDGVNDTYSFYGGPSLEIVEQFQIFGRWGELLFDQAEFIPGTSDNGWDGEFQGKTMPAGIYTYLARVRFIDGEVFEYSGDVLLLR